MVERVEAVAIRVNGEVITQPRPARHAHLLVLHPDTHPHPWLDQGFVLSDGTFVNRLEAIPHAIAAGQIDAPKWPPYLYSEDLW